MRDRQAVFSGVFLLLLWLECWAVPAIAWATIHPARRGEAFTFAVKMLGSVEAGRARLAILPVQFSKQGPIVQVRGESEAVGMAKSLTGWQQKYTLLLDGNTLLPRRIEQTDQGRIPRQATFVVTGRHFQMTVQKPDAQWQTGGTLRADLLDPVSVLLLLRGLRLQDGDTIKLFVTGGTALYRAELRVVGREKIQTTDGSRRAIHLSGRGERINERDEVIGKTPWLGELWLSDDTLRLPLVTKTETVLGTAEFSLTSHDIGAQTLSVPRNAPAFLVIPKPK